jgi:hypothetical protein
VTINADDILDVTRAVTKEWTKQRKAEERGRPRYTRQYVYSDRVNFTDVADAILPKGYAHASGNGRYTVSNRQFYYAVREAFKERTGRVLEFGYFAGNLLVKYLNRHRPGWKITADPRGTLTLPNTGDDTRIPCGTIQIDNHLREAALPVDAFDDVRELEAKVEWPSLAPGQRYRAVLYIEKEGFGPLLEEAKIAERFELAVLSCKGMSVVAARKFVDHVCYKGSGVPLLTVHDLDKYGFEIAQRLVSVSDGAQLEDRVAYEFRNEIDVIDLGLKLEDARHYDLQEEDCEFKGRFAKDSLASEEEQEFLESGRRIELNAFTSPDFIEWLEAKLTENGFGERLIPGDEILAKAWGRALAVAKLNEAIEEVREEAIESAESAEVPKNLRRKLSRALRGSAEAWDKVLYAIAREQLDSEDHEE